MELTLSEILKDDNNGKIFRHIESGSIVKNVNGTLFFGEILECKLPNEKKDVKESNKNKWKEAAASSFWVNGKYEK